MGMITYLEENKIIKIDTNNTTYAMQIVRDKFVSHIYYGKKTDNLENLYTERPLSFTTYVASEGVAFSLDTIPTELSFFGSGDTKDTAVKIKNQNGDSVTLFYYQKHNIYDGSKPIDGLPYSKNGKATLEVIYYDAVSKVKLYSYYVVFPESDTIVRYNKLTSENDVLVQKIASCQLDINASDFNVVTFSGKYCCERLYTEYPLHIGKQSIYSERGHSSHHFNPFMILKNPNADENDGEAYGFQFVYSGDFEIQAEKLANDTTRVLAGLNANTFAWNLKNDLVTPEVILTYSDKGVGQLSRNYHDHLRNHIIDPKFVFKPRPVVLNTWEAAYFNINEEKLYDYAESAKKLGMDTLVVDDGWFGARNDDSSSLGDWVVNTQKFKGGLKAFSDKVHSYGMNFGIWIEPEMVNPNSELFRAHPEWVLVSKDRPYSLGRKQLVLDMCNDEVIAYIVDLLKKAFDGVKIEYIKWDFNRSLTEVGSSALTVEEQCEAKHRFVLGSYKLHKALTEAFPDTIFEGCSGGGGRFDAGLLSFVPQIWTSDNTDPVSRLKIQYGTSFAYPLSTISSHVSKTLINKVEASPDYDFRFFVTLAGVLGYELDPTAISAADGEKIIQKINLYHSIEDLILRGDLYRGEFSPTAYSFAVIAKDKSSLYAVAYDLTDKKSATLKINGINDNVVYTDDSGKKYTGKQLKKGIKVNVANHSAFVYLILFGGEKR